MRRKMWVVKRQLVFGAKGKCDSWGVAARGRKLDVVFPSYNDMTRIYLFDTERKARNFKEILEEMKNAKEYKFKVGYVYM